MGFIFINYRMSFAIDKSGAMKRGRSHQALTTNLRVANGECVLGARIAGVFCRNAKSRGKTEIGFFQELNEFNSIA